MLKAFKGLIMKDNAVDLAIAVIAEAAFGATGSVKHISPIFLFKRSLL